MTSELDAVASSNSTNIILPSIGCLEGTKHAEREGSGTQLLIQHTQGIGASIHHTQGIGARSGEETLSKAVRSIKECCKDNINIKQHTQKQGKSQEECEHVYQHKQHIQSIGADSVEETVGRESEGQGMYQIESETRSENQTESQTRLENQTESQTRSETQSETQSSRQTEAETESQRQTESETYSGRQSETESQRETESEPESMLTHTHTYNQTS